MAAFMTEATTRDEIKALMHVDEFAKIAKEMAACPGETIDTDRPAIKQDPYMSHAGFGNYLSKIGKFTKAVYDEYGMNPAEFKTAFPNAEWHLWNNADDTVDISLIGMPDGRTRAWKGDLKAVDA